MPEQNQPIQGAFGDIYRVETPNIDRASQQLQQQYADRKAYLQKESASANETLNKEMANIRSIDTPDVIDAYNEYKSARQNQLFNKAIQNNPKLYAEAQMDANAKLAKATYKINRSKELNAFGKQLSTNRFQKPDTYSDDAGDMLSTFYQTPADQLTSVKYKDKIVDFTNPDSWLYGPGSTNLTGTYEKAAGKPVVHYDNGTTDESGLQTTQHGFQYGNTPLQFRNTAITGLAGSQASRRARYDWAQHSASQQDLDQLDTAYQNSPNWGKLGIQPQSLPPYNPNDPIGNEATYQAKQYLVGLNPNEVKAATTTNQGAKMKATFSHQELMEAIKEGNREKLASMRHDWKQLDIKAQSTVLDDTFNAMFDDAKKSGQYSYKSANGNVSKQYEIKASPALKKEFSVPDDKGHPIYPDAFRIDDSGQSVTPLFFKPGQTGGYRAVETNVSKPMTSIEFKARLGKALFGTRQAAKESEGPEIKTTESQSISNQSTGKKTISGW